MKAAMARPCKGIKKSAGIKLPLEREYDLCRMEHTLIHDRRPLQVLTPEVFDRFMEHGWRILGSAILRHSAVVYNNELVYTIPVRIRMDGFSFAGSHKKLLRKHNARFTTRVKAIEVTDEKEQLFLKHCDRLEHGNHYTTFITSASHYLPVAGLEMEVYDGDRLVACSYFHLGNTAFCATYCFFDPEYQQFSLGNYTMLLEIELAKSMGKSHYYSGYVHHKPSQFDYKLNFNNMEKFSWEESRWVPQERKVPVKRS